MSKEERKKGKFKFKKAAFIFVFGFIILAVMVPLFFLGVFDIFDNKLTDFRFKYFNQKKEPSKEIVFLDIDEESLQALSPFFGGWPWRRGEIISDRILNYVMQDNPSIFLFDIVYTTITSKSIDEEISLEDEKLFLTTITLQSEGKNVSHAILFSKDPLVEAPYEVPPTNYGYDGFEIAVEDKQNYLQNSEYNTVTLPFPTLYAETLQFHSVTHLEDMDGVSRNYRLLIKYKDKFYPSLCLRSLITKLGITKISVVNKKLVLEYGDNEKIAVNIDKNGIMPLSFYSDYLKFNSITAGSVVVSAQKQIDGLQLDRSTDVLPEEFTDKIIVIGSSAVGLKDVKITPVTENLPGPFIHITAISNILNNHHIYKVPKPAAALIIIISVFFILATATMIKNTYAKNIIGFGYILLLFIVAIFLFKYFSITLELATTLISGVISYFASLVFLSLTEARDKKFLKSTFGSYLSPELIDEMFANKEMPTLGGESRPITAYFTDIQGFSTFSEKLTAVQLVELLNEYLTAMTDILLGEKGTLDKYEGDAIIAFFGAPMKVIDHPVRAISAAIGMQNKLLELRDKWDDEKESPDEPKRNTKDLPPEEWVPGEKWPKIVHEMRMRIGINTGEIVVGNMGSSTRMNYTMMGDSVNLAARLEAGAKQYGVFTLVSEFAMNYQFTDEATGEKKVVRDFFDYRFIDKIVVVGKSEPVKVFEVVSLKGGLTEKEKELFRIYSSGVKYYLEQNWDEAIKYFKESLEIERFPDAKTNPSKVYIDRCAFFKKNSPGEKWDGSWTLTSK